MGAFKLLNLLDNRFSITRGLSSLARVFRELRLYLLREAQKENLNALRRNFMGFTQPTVSDPYSFDFFPKLFDDGAFLAIERIDLDSHLFRYLPWFQLPEFQLNQSPFALRQTADNRPQRSTLILVNERLILSRRVAQDVWQ